MEDDDDEWRPADARSQAAAHGDSGEEEDETEAVTRIESAAEDAARRLEAAQAPLTAAPAGVSNVIMHDYQLEGVAWMSAAFRCDINPILADDMGLGKTLQAIALFVHVRNATGSRQPALVVAPLSIVDNWRSEIERFAPQLRVVAFYGDKQARAEMRQRFVSGHAHVAAGLPRARSDGGDGDRTESDTDDDGDDGSRPRKRRPATQRALRALPSSHPAVRDFEANAQMPFDILLTSYETVLAEFEAIQSRAYLLLIVDEAARLKNAQSALYRHLSVVWARHRLLLTGTPLQNNFTELYALLHFLAPTVFSSARAKSFVAHFTPPAGKPADGERTRQLQRILRPYMLRRLKADVLAQLPQKKEIYIHVDMSDLQRKYYLALLKKDLLAFETRQKGGLTNMLMQLRKCVNHPYLFDGVEPEPFELGEHLVDASGKLQVLDRLLVYLRRSGHRVLLFSQMTHMLDILQDYAAYRGFSYERLDGSVRGQERFLAVRSFTQQQDTFLFLLSTRAGGVGLNLVAADVVIFYDSDMNPQMDLQAAARAHRLGQQRDVYVLRLITRDSVEEVIMRRAHKKLLWSQAVLAAGQRDTTAAADTVDDLVSILKVGMAELVADAPQRRRRKHADEYDFDEIFSGGDGASGRLQTVDRSHGVAESDKDTIYLYGGTDYSETVARAADKDDDDAYRRLVADATSSAVATASSASAAPGRVTKRKTLLSEEEIQAAADAAELIKRQRREERARLAEERRAERWKAAGYVSLNLPAAAAAAAAGGDAAVDVSDDSDSKLAFVTGDVSQPQDGDRPAVIVNCVDASGSWGRGGVFSALDRLSARIGPLYELAGEHGDLHLGDCHVIDVADVAAFSSRRRVWVALVVAQKRDSDGYLQPVSQNALDTAFRRLRAFAVQHGASVHMPRIGARTPNFDWYKTERTIRRQLAARGVPTFIYYYPRRGGGSSLPASSSPPPAPLPRTADTDSETDADGSGVSGDEDAAGPSTAAVQETSVSPESSLADVFSGCRIALLGPMSDEQRATWERYIVAFDGDVVGAADATATHAVRVDGDHSATPPHVIHASGAWLDACIAQRRLLPAF